MLYTTFARAKKEKACIESYKRFAKFKGGITKWGADKPFPLSEVLDVCGLEDAIWCLRCTIEPSENTLIEFACRCAEHVLHFYEDKYPEDKRPRQAIEATRVYITDKSATALAVALAARDAARDAAGDAADATGVAAGDAALAAWATADVTWATAGATWAVRAARDAADAARVADDATWAARVAGGAAETEWQTLQLKELLEASQC